MSQTYALTVRVPEDQTEAWRTLFRAARTVGVTPALARLTAPADADAALDRLTALLPVVQAVWPGPESPPTTADALLGWLCDQATQVAQQAQTAQRLAQHLAALQAAVTKHEQTLTALRDQITAEQRTWHLTQTARQLVIALAGAEWTVEDLTQWARLIQAAGVTPATYEALWREYGGLEALMRRLEPEVQRLTALRDQLTAALPGAAQAVQEAQQRVDAALAELRDVQAAVEQARATAATETTAAEQWRQIATGLGWWIPEIGQTWEAVGRTATGVERALAGTLLLAAVRREGDLSLTLPARTEPGLFRLPTAVRLSELIGVIAPPDLAQAILAGATPAPTPAATADA
jgi:flagellar biosynthesis chaperone FliJ